jgi:hypothetical protein
VLEKAAVPTKVKAWLPPVLISASQPETSIRSTPVWKSVMLSMI